MADFLKTLKGEQLVQISNDFDYIKATADFVGLKLMPMDKTDNMKVAMYDFLDGADVPVVALVHALDSEARIGDRPDYEVFREELFLIKQKLNQGEELRKKIKDMGMSAEEKAIVNAIYDDAANLISAVLTGFERRACELLSTGKNVINENGAERTIDHHLSNDNKIDFASWADPDHDIMADFVALQEAADNKIVRQIISKKIVKYILNNNKLKALAAADVNQGYLTQKYAFDYIKRIAMIEDIKVDDRTFKLSHKDTKEYRFFDEDTIISLTTMDTIGKTFMTSTPTEDANEEKGKYGFVALDQWVEHDPKTSWTLAEGLGLSVIRNINDTLFISKVTA